MARLFHLVTRQRHDSDIMVGNEAMYEADTGGGRQASGNDTRWATRQPGNDTGNEATKNGNPSSEHGKNKQGNDQRQRLRGPAVLH